MLTVTVEKSTDGEGVTVVINGRATALPIYRGDVLLPDGQVHVMQLIHEAVAREISPIQPSAFHAHPYRMRSYKLAHARRKELGLE